MSSKQETEQNMCDRLTVNYAKKPCYEIVYRDSFKDLSKEVEPFVKDAEKICVITDTVVAPLYAEEVKKALAKLKKQVDVYEIEAGESHKNLDSITEIYRFLVSRHYTRKDVLLALGGGVVGDMTGFTAATYLRGIDFIQIPTTLLAQVDSSIGGKTGVDLDGYKNMVGAFYMPKLVYENVATLKSLDDRQFASGFAEAMKHGLIKDAKYYTWMLDNIYEIGDRETDVLKELVYRSNLIKKAVVEKDPTEQGDRVLLNFGHTIGHAIEKAAGFSLLHGECVALGCVAAAQISFMHELISKDEYLEVRDMFVPFGLPITLDYIDPEEILKNVQSDKKNASGSLRFILLSKIGKAVVDTSVSGDDMRYVIKELLLMND